jgi:hypothetical protein
MGNPNNNLSYFTGFEKCFRLDLESPDRERNTYFSPGIFIQQKGVISPEG